MILVGSDGDRIVLGEEATSGGGLLVPSPGRPGNKGDKGDKGDTGPKGDTGAASTVPGPQGIQGVQGERGPKGDTGADSTVPGPKGDRGDVGPKGDKGDTGADSAVPGPKGDKGDQGERGLQGEASTVPGPKGDKGDPGGVTTVGGFDGVVTKAQLGIDQLDNTRDQDKPLSIPQAEALDSIEQSGQIYTDSKIGPLETGLANTSATAAQTAANLSYLVDSANEPLGILVLGEDGKIMSPQLPSYVDDVLAYTSLAAFPNTGEKGKIYTAEDTNRVYRWGGSSYIEVSPSPGSTDAVPEGQVNLYFTNARAVAAAKSGLQVPYPLTLAATLGTRKVGMTELVTGSGPLADGVTFSKMVLTFETADASGNTSVQILKNGGTMSGMTLTCSAAAQAGAIAGRTVTGSWAFAVGDVLTVQITGVGTTPGRGLTVSLTGKAGIPA